MVVAAVDDVEEAVPDEAELVPEDVEDSVVLPDSRLGSLNPHPVLPLVFATATAEHTPMLPKVAQHSVAQSALEAHWPVMNCWPLPLPTFSAPGAPSLIPWGAGRAKAVTATGQYQLQAQTAGNLDHRDLQARAAAKV